jgi:hypothetical protein
VIEQHVNIVLYVCSGDGVEVKEEEEQIETRETGECSVQAVHEHCSITD